MFSILVRTGVLALFFELQDGIVAIEIGKINETC
jgi:hypothetical protein